MLTKQQVFEAALKYAQGQNPDESKAAIMPDGDFIAGAFWAADLLEAEVERLTASVNGLQAEAGCLRAEYDKMYERFKSSDNENNRLRLEIGEKRAKIEALSALKNRLGDWIAEMIEKIAELEGIAKK